MSLSHVRTERIALTSDREGEQMDAGRDAAHGIERTILVVEDERIIARDLQSRLRRLGYTVPTIAGSGEEALTKAEQIQPQLILMDINLRGKMDGIETARQIGERLKIPVIFLTAYDDEMTVKRARNLDPVDYLGKPFEDQALSVALNQFFSRNTRKP